MNTGTMKTGTMKTRLLALMFTVVMALGVATPVAAEAAAVNTRSVTVDFTLSNVEGVYYHNPSMQVTDFDLTPYFIDELGNLSHGVTLVHALTQVHRDAFLGGEESSLSDLLTFTSSGWISKCWGSDESLTYFINGKQVDTVAPETVLKNGDQINVTMYDFWNGETFASFDTYKKSVTAGKEFTLTLVKYVYDNNWNLAERPVADADIVTIDRESLLAPSVASTGYTTDENGEVTMKFDDPGVYTVSAQNGDITRPVCTVTVTEAPAGSSGEYIPGASQEAVSGDTANSGGEKNDANSSENGSVSGNDKEADVTNDQESSESGKGLTRSEMKKALNKVTVSAAKSVKAGAKTKINVTVPKSIREITKISYKTSSKNAYVSKKGILKGKKKGTVKVTVTVKVSADGNKDLKKKITKTVKIK